jgi:predicted ATPase
MSHDRITQLRISGLRTIADLTLDLRGLTVLIGDNGTGKSSILEALELLRLAAKPVVFVSDIVGRAHGGMAALLRRGADVLRLGVTIEGNGPKLDYDLSLGLAGAFPVVLSETLESCDSAEGARSTTVLDRTGTEAGIVERDATGEWEPKAFRAAEAELILPKLGLGWHPAFQRAVDALSSVDLHVPFETRPLWQQRAFDVRKGPRWPSEVNQSDRLERYALNLPIAFQRLRNLGDEIWNRVLVRARLGLGDDVRGFRLTPSGRGNLELELVLASTPDQSMPAEYLSEGQLAYLAFLALVELDAHRAVLGFDEPELHLHPALLTRVVWMLEEAAERAPVILATHSDRLLDGLSDPLHSVVLCELDEHRSTRLRRPNPEALADWLEDYRGIGSIRAEGYEPYVFEALAEEDRRQ